MGKRQLCLWLSRMAQYECGAPRVYKPQCQRVMGKVGALCPPPADKELLRSLPPELVTPTIQGDVNTGQYPDHRTTLGAAGQGLYNPPPPE